MDAVPGCVSEGAKEPRSRRYFKVQSYSRLREKKVCTVEESTVTVIVVWTVGTDTVDGDVELVELAAVLLLVAFELAVELAVELDAELPVELGRMPQRPNPRMQPVPQCSSVLPHQPSGEQQSPYSEPIHVWPPPPGPHLPSRVKPETDGVGVAVVERMVVDGIIGGTSVLLVGLDTVTVTAVVVDSETSRSSTQYLVPAVR
ncbi:hypothetical protein GE09DRAFT_1287461 [Coniochaeta sp. 2T2.1]|nr:hypothetical protein GE09DRAFT_1287461 [Coniochaeta sp. 2T2.1]